jgi:hypothetical protein
MPILLHVGCGMKRKAQTTRAFDTPEWTELRLDIDPAVEPDIVGTITDMKRVASASIDAIFSSHNIEHLYPHEVPLALAEFLRVLRPEGFAVVTCPDLQSVAALVADDKLDQPAYVSPAGPIAPLDMIYGHRPDLARGQLFMAHRTGFTRTVLIRTLQEAGFAQVAGMQRARAFDLWAIAGKLRRDPAMFQQLAMTHLPVSQA